jgi:hypothetical protein
MYVRIYVCIAVYVYVCIAVNVYELCLYVCMYVCRYMLRSCFDLIACIRITVGNGCILSRFFTFNLTSNKFIYIW